MAQLLEPNVKRTLEQLFRATHKRPDSGGIFLCSASVFDTVEATEELQKMLLNEGYEQMRQPAESNNTIFMALTVEGNINPEPDYGRILKL